MGSPKEPHRLQLSKPDGASENTALRSPISSRIWQAEDPTLNSEFDGEDLCMRNFCVSVQGDHEFPEGSFSFDTDNVLGAQRDFSLDTDSTYAFHEGKQDHILSRQEDSSKSEESDMLLQSSSFTSVSEIKTTETEVCRSENIKDCKGESQNVLSKIEESTSSGSNLVSVLNREKECISPQDKKQEEDTNEHKNETQAKKLAECTKVGNGELSGKASISDHVLSNPKTGEQEKQYRSIAISPIVPHDSHSSFTFPTLASEPPSAKKRTDEKEIGKNEDLPKTYSFELTPPDGDTETKRYISVAVSPIIIPGDTSSSFTFQTDHDIKPQGDIHISANVRTDTGQNNSLQKPCSPENVYHTDGVKNRVEYKSVAVSPIIPPDGSSFTFQPLRTGTDGELTQKRCSIELTAPNQDVGTQVKAECVSVAVSPIIPPAGTSSFIFQTEHQSGARMLETQDSCANSSQQSDSNVRYVSVAVSPIVLPGGSSSFTFLSDKPTTVVEHNIEKEIKSTDNLLKTCSFEITPPDEETGTKSKIEYRSIAVSPIIPPHEVSFTFQKEKEKNDVAGAEEQSKTHSIKTTPSNQNDGTQADKKVECVSVAVSPFVFSEGSSPFSFQEPVPLQHDQIQKQESYSKPSETLLDAKPQYQDVGTQVDCIVQCTSIAISPMPVEGSSPFIFHTDGVNQASSICSHSVEKPTMKDAEMQVSFSVETRSIATGPMTPKGKSPPASEIDIRVKDTKPGHPEPVREVSWDEKGMTWEVYGASMEVEVLGMAIQKHLEKQIEEHGKRDKVMTPQNTRASSMKGAATKTERKRQPGAFSSFFRRRPRCCSRAGPAVD